MLGAADLERVRDALVVRVREAQAEIARRADVEEANRVLVEEMIADPDRYRWVRVSNEDVGERECKHWHARPRWGILGMLLGWWRVRVSSGCPLAGGGCPSDEQEAKEASHVASRQRDASRRRPLDAPVSRRSAGSPPPPTSARPRRGGRFRWSRSRSSSGS